MRIAVFAGCLLLAVAGCGGSEPTLAEYAEQVEALTTAMYSSTDPLAAELEAMAVPSAGDLQRAYGELAKTFRTFSDGLDDVKPPSDIADMHDQLLAMADRLASTNEALSAIVDEYEDGDDWEALMRTPEAQAARAAGLAILDFCQARQAELDATADREGLSDAPWIPADMQEVILVAFGCDRS